MDQLTSLGVILLLALLAGHLVKFLRIPEVTGYLLAGVAMGPSVLGWLSRDNVVGLGVLGEVALGLILFSVGSVFEFGHFRRVGRQVLVLTLAESTAAAIFVLVGARACGQPWPVAGLLGVVAMATAPASTLMVVRECDSAGPLTDNLLGIVAVNNLLCLSTFGIVAAAIELGAAVGGSDGFGPIVYRSLFTLMWHTIGSAALGFLVGLLLSSWSSRVTESGEMLILLAGSILLCVGVARLMELSPLVASLAVGATMINLTTRSRSVFSALSGTDPPFYVIFFVIAGAELDVRLIPAMGLVGLTYVIGRAAGKLGGATAAAFWLRLPEPVRHYLGFSLLAQAGLAVGLTFAISRRFEAYGGVVSTVVLASVAVYEVVGPLSTRFALVRAGEAGRATSQAPDGTVLDPH